jgi:hypothetical protein
MTLIYHMRRVAGAPNPAGKPEHVLRLINMLSGGCAKLVDLEPA